MSIFKKDSSFDLDKYLLEKYNLVLDRSHGMSPEFQKAIEEELEKYIKKMSCFVGEYRCDIQNGCIHIPWELDSLNDQFAWMLILSDQQEKIVFTYADHNIETTDCSIFQQGACAFGENGDWILPKTVLDILSSKTCVWVGRSGYAELLSYSAYSAVFDEQNTDDLIKQLKNL